MLFLGFRAFGWCPTLRGGAVHFSHGLDHGGGNVVDGVLTDHLDEVVQPRHLHQELAGLGGGLHGVSHAAHFHGLAGGLGLQLDGGLADVAPRLSVVAIGGDSVQVDGGAFGVAREHGPLQIEDELDFGLFRQDVVDKDA